MTLIFCAGFTIIIMLYQQFINPDYYQTLKDFTMKQMQDRGATPKEMELVQNELKEQAGGSALSYLLLFVFSAIWGLGISAIASMILRKSTR